MRRPVIAAGLTAASGAAAGLRSGVVFKQRRRFGRASPGQSLPAGCEAPQGLPPFEVGQRLTTSRCGSEEEGAERADEKAQQGKQGFEQRDRLSSEQHRGKVIPFCRISRPLLEGACDWLDSAQI